MINANLIARRIDSTCDILGGEENLKVSGFHNIIGYINLLKELNQMTNEMVSNIVCDLNEMEGIYKSFGEHIINDGVLIGKFFEVKKNNETIIEDNFNVILENKLKEEDDEIKKVYENNKNIFNNTSLEFIKNEKLKEEYELTQNSFNYQFEKRIEGFKNKLNPTIYDWITKEIPLLSDEDYGMFMSLIYKLRKNE